MRQGHRFGYTAEGDLRSSFVQRDRKPIPGDSPCVQTSRAQTQALI